VQPGDLILHQNTYTAGLSHVGMYVGNGKMINALNENAGVVITDITTSYWESRWYGARRL
jgi:cell wall-associated NlpC family hydrolase